MQFLDSLVPKATVVGQVVGLLSLEIARDLLSVSQSVQMILEGGTYSSTLRGSFHHEHFEVPQRLARMGFIDRQQISATGDDGRWSRNQRPKCGASLS
jgi:hypothetical protein